MFNIYSHSPASKGGGGGHVFMGTDSVRWWGKSKVKTIAIDSGVVSPHSGPD